MTNYKFSVVSAGNFDLKHLYKMMYEWLRTNEWKSMKGDSEANKSEVFYRQTEEVGGLMHHIIWWRIKKNPSFSKDFEYNLKINISTTAIAKKEITTPDGKKIKTDKGEIKVEIQASSKYLPDDKWKSGFEKFMLKFYKQWKGDLFVQADNDLYLEAYTLQAHIKQYLNLRQFITAPQVELFHPRKEYSRGK